MEMERRSQKKGRIVGMLFNNFLGNFGLSLFSNMFFFLVNRLVIC